MGLELGRRHDFTDIPTPISSHRSILRRIDMFNDKR